MARAVADNSPDPSDLPMDTSLLQHLTLAPAVSPDWRICATYRAIGVASVTAGGWQFTRRDLQGH
jgi:hypothetical protein